MGMVDFSVSSPQPGVALSAVGVLSQNTPTSRTSIARHKNKLLNQDQVLHSCWMQLRRDKGTQHIAPNPARGKGASRTSPISPPKHLPKTTSPLDVLAMLHASKRPNSWPHCALPEDGIWRVPGMPSQPQPQLRITIPVFQSILIKYLRQHHQQQKINGSNQAETHRNSRGVSRADAY